MLRLHNIISEHEIKKITTQAQIKSRNKKNMFKEKNR